MTKKLKIILGLSGATVIVLALIFGWVFIINKPKVDSQIAATNFLKALYGSDPVKTRNLASGNLQIVKTDNELAVNPEDVQEISDIKYSKVEKPKSNTVLLAGVFKSTQPQQTEKGKNAEEISNVFALRLIKQDGKWKADAYQVY